MKGKTIRKLTAEQYIKIPVITWRNYPEETRHESNPHLAPRLPWTSMNMLSKSWEIPHPHGLTMPSNTIKIPHITPHRPGVGGGGGGGGVSTDKCISWENGGRITKTPALIAGAPFPFPSFVLFSLPLSLPFLRLVINGDILGNKNPTQQERTQVYVAKKRAYIV